LKDCSMFMLIRSIASCSRKRCLSPCACFPATRQWSDTEASSWRCKTAMAKSKTICSRTECRGWSPTWQGQCSHGNAQPLVFLFSPAAAPRTVSRAWSTTCTILLKEIGPMEHLTHRPWEIGRTSRVARCLISRPRCWATHLRWDSP